MVKGHRFVRGFPPTEPLTYVASDARILLNGTAEMFRQQMDRILRALREGRVHEVERFVDEAVATLDAASKENPESSKAKEFAQLIRERTTILKKIIEEDLSKRAEALTYHARG